MKRNAVKNLLFGGMISLLLIGCAPLDDVSFARTTMELLIKGRYSARARLDWPVLKIITADVGKEYSGLKTSKDKSGYEQSFIKSFSENYKKSGANASILSGWRTFNNFKTTGPNMTIVAAYTRDKANSLLFIISHKGNTKKIIAILAAGSLDNVDATKNQ